MKTLAYILGGIAVACCAALAGVVLYIIHSTDSEKNRTKTEAARAARWQRPADAEPVVNGTNHVNLKVDEIKT